MKNLTTGNVYKTFFSFGFPIVLTGVLSQAYNLIDTIIAGKIIGESALGAMGAVSPFITFVSSVFWGLGSGFAIYIAKVFGEKDYVKAKTAINTMGFLFIAAAILLGAVSVVAHDGLFGILNVDESIRSDTFAYFSIYMAGFFLIMTSEFGGWLLNSFGNSTLPLVMMLITSVLNISGNIASVVVLGWGLTGIALSSVVSAGVTCIGYFIAFLRMFSRLEVKGSKLFELRSIKQSVAYFMPNTLQQMTMYVAWLFISPLINGMGVAASAAYAVVAKINDFLDSIYVGTSKTLSNYVAQCDGAKKYGEINKGIKAGIVQGTAFIVPVIALFMIFYKPVCELFFKSGTDALARDYAYLFMLRFLPFAFFVFLCNFFHGLYRGVKAMRYLFISTLFASVVKFVVSVILIKYYGITGFYIGMASAWIAETVLNSIIYVRGKWRPEYRDKKIEARKQI